MQQQQQQQQQVFSKAQRALFHAAESAGMAALVTGASALYQYYLAHGLNVAALGGIALSTFIGALGMIYKSLASNPTLVAQAEQETARQALAAIEPRVAQLEQRILAALPFLHAHPPQASAPVAGQAPSALRPVTLASLLPQVSMPMPVVPPAPTA